jgi:uncharacterized protein YjbJ (UPF0337 family)
MTLTPLTAGDQLVGKLQERYGYAKDQAEREVENFSRTC